MPYAYPLILKIYYTNLPYNFISKRVIAEILKKSYE